MTEAERIDLIRDLENACDRVREMYPDALDAPQPLRHLFNRLVPRAVTMLRNWPRTASPKCQNNGDGSCQYDAWISLCNQHYMKALEAYRAAKDEQTEWRMVVPGVTVRIIVEAKK